jgi:hypothetical protein
MYAQVESVDKKSSACCPFSGLAAGGNYKQTAHLFSKHKSPKCAAQTSIKNMNILQKINSKNCSNEAKD